MSNPHRYAIVRIGTQHSISFRDAARRSHIVHFQSSRDLEWRGDYTEEGMVYWADDYDMCVELTAFLMRSFPKNSYAVMEAKDIWYLPNVNPIRAQYNEQGLMPV